MLNRFKSFLPLFTILLVLSFQGFTNNDSPGSGLDTKNLNPSVKPQDNFYEYATGGWMKNNPIPPEYSRWGTFEMLSEENYKVLKKILETAAEDKTAKQGTPDQMIGDFYATGMDTNAIEKSGIEPISQYLLEINALNDKMDMVKLVAKLHQLGTGGFFNFFAGIDSKSSNMNAAQIRQGGVNLPDVEYYTKDDDHSKEIREKYLTHIVNMFKLIGVSETRAKQYADVVMKLETELAKASNTRLQNRDPEKTYNKMDVRELKYLANGFDWDIYFDGLGVKNIGNVIVGQPKFLEELSKMMKDVSLNDWKIYLKWNVIHDAAPYLSSAFENENFDFYGKYLNGQKEQQPRWKRVLFATNSAMGMMLGKLYVQEVFPPEAKARAKAIVDNLLKAMGERIKNVEWMSQTTKDAALKKLSTFGVKIGYPDRWKDYTGLTIKRDSYFNNVMRANEWATQDNLKKINQPVDQTEWGMTPQTVNAYYSPQRNEIVFPAAILQPPFFDPNADDAVNYGAMGAVIGHEITHGFDDQGRQFDADGNLRDWWTKEDNDKFKARAQKLIDEYNSFTPVDTFHINGALTLGENIADLGGLTVSFTAFKNTDQYKNGEKIDGFTPAQRFFLSWAQVWRNNIRDSALKLRLKTDVHSPGYFRVNGPLMNMPEFFEAFDVKPNDPMRNSDDKIVKIW